MITVMPRYRLGIAVIAYAVMLITPVRYALEFSMTAQMLVQIPLLIGVGCLLGSTDSPRLRKRTEAWDRGGITGLLLASMTALVWMLPRLLDASLTDSWVAAAKFISVPLLIGLPLALSWPRMGFIVRGVFVLELIATFFRLGWLYLISPIQLCSNYLLSDQQRLGEYMLVIGAVLLVAVIYKLLCGRFVSLM